MNLGYASLKLAVRIYQTLLPQDCRVFGVDRLPPGAKIIAANHPNCTDTFFLPFVIKEQLHILIKGVHFGNPVIRWVLIKSGHIPVHPGQGGDALQEACECLAKGEAVLIYPEAQWNPENRRLKGKSGAVRMSLATGAPIIPLGIYVPDENTRTVRVNNHGQTRQARWQTKGGCYLCFGDPWLPSGETQGEADPDRIHTLTDQLMGRIYDQSRLALLKSRLELPVERIPAGIEMAGIRVARFSAGDSTSVSSA